jgi:hypothetical protein
MVKEPRERVCVCQVILPSKLFDEGMSGDPAVQEISCRDGWRTLPK